MLGKTLRADRARVLPSVPGRASPSGRASCPPVGGGRAPRRMNFPTEMFTVMFALGRLPGWIAQWKEMIEHGEPIGRPRQVYTGSTKRDYVPIPKRG